MEIQLNDIYNIRPDIFVKGSEDRLHIQHGGKNFILRLQRELIGSLYECLGRMDGIRSIGNILGLLPEAHRAPVLKFVGFLIEKGAAFCVADPEGELALAPVSDTLGYLRLYADNSAATFTRFVEARILIVAGGYALASAVKTCARLGVRQLHLVNTDPVDTGAWSDTMLHACFDELKRWPDAALTILPPSTSDLPRFDHVLHMIDDGQASMAHQRIIAACADAEQLVGASTGRHLCLMRAEDYVQVDQTRFHGRGVEPGKLIAGAATALFFFDHLCNIRRLRPGRYHYYSLHGESTLRFAGLDRLIPVDAIVPGNTASAPSSGAPLHTLLAEPLFPLQNMVEHTDPSCYIKLYTLDFATAHGVGTLIAAGLDTQGCEASLLAQLVTHHGVWFGQSDAAELALIHQLRARQADADQVARGIRDRGVSHDKPLFPELTAPEQYIAFCINAGFGQRLHWRDVVSGDGALPMCTLLSAGDIVLYIPHGGVLAMAERQAALLALYAALWNKRVNASTQQHVIIAPGVILPHLHTAAA